MKIRLLVLYSLLFEIKTDLGIRFLFQRGITGPRGIKQKADLKQARRISMKSLRPPGLKTRRRKIKIKKISGMSLSLEAGRYENLFVFVSIVSLTKRENGDGKSKENSLFDFLTKN